MGLNWNNIRPLGNSLNAGFEELVCQLARNEIQPDAKTFIRKGSPDAGVECFWVLNNGDEIAWQAKYFTTSLGNSEWDQLDSSVNTALEKHPKLKTYYIAMPLDPPDARIDGQTSMLEKWNSRVDKWERWADNNKMSVRFIPWWSSDLIKRLHKPENAGMRYFWFNKEEFTDEWFEEHCKEAIANLGHRYTPELNVELKISNVFNAISRNGKFRNEISGLMDKLLISGNKINFKHRELQENHTEFCDILRKIENSYLNTEWFGIEKLPTEDLLKQITKISVTTSSIKNHYLEEEEKLKKQDNEYSRFGKFSAEIREIGDFEFHLYTFKEFLESEPAKLANFPYLLLEGEAGVGKSHLLADAVERRIKEDCNSLFFLGQHFTTDEDPWTQIFKKAKINCSEDEFLGALSSKAQISGQRLLIFIDAINEGRGKFFWDKYIRGFLTKLQKFPWLGVVFSIRTSYSKLIFPEGEFSKDVIIRYTHYGFGEKEYDAIKLFFHNYKIELPSMPQLHPEFQNPLFLLLFCEGLNKIGLTRVPRGLYGITSIIQFFINNINLKLSAPSCLNYPKDINVVQKAIDVLIEYKIENAKGYIPYEEAFLLVEEVSNRYGAGKRLLDELISEGLLSKNLFWYDYSESEEGIYLAYERFEDHLTASLLLDKYPNIEQALCEGGELFYLIEDEWSCNRYRGILEAFAIQLPERTGTELHHYTDHLKNSEYIIDYFLQSLVWRKLETITEDLIGFVNTKIMRYKRIYESFLDTILTVTSVPNHLFNAYSLHNHLMKLSLPDRDASWTIYLKNKLEYDSSAKRIIDWAWSEDEKDYITDESIKLISITLAWFHTSTNRELRDSATKALVCLLENRIHVLIELLKQFEEVNDPYIYERLYAVAYGCSVRTIQIDNLVDLANYVFETIFKDKDEIYPHILLRDYARGIIEFASFKGCTLDFNLSGVRPPYKSSFPTSFPSNEEIDYKYKIDYNAKDLPKHYYSQNSILSSMVTEYGRGIGSYGDFGRYTFQNALEKWDIDVDSLSNLAIHWIFEKYGYDKESHGKFDRAIGTGRLRGSNNERIGKKYQWLAFHEILARVSDNCTMKKLAYGDTKLIGYQGPWWPHVRDVDPTVTICVTNNESGDASNQLWWCPEKVSGWDMENEEWIKHEDDLPDPKKLIEVNDLSSNEWLILESHPEWVEPKKIGEERLFSQHKRVCYSLDSYLIQENEFGKFKEWAKKAIFMDIRMPEGMQSYELFSREYYWSPAYNCFVNEYERETSYFEINDDITKTFICNLLPTTHYFLREKELHKSDSATISFLKPSRHIYENMKMNFSKREGEFIDENGGLICFDPSIYSSFKPCLLIKREPFVEYLRENNLRIVWTMIGEKQIPSGHLQRERFNKWLSIYGLYYLCEKNNVVGDFSNKIEKPT